MWFVNPAEQSPVIHVTGLMLDAAQVCRHFHYLPTADFDKTMRIQRGEGDNKLTEESDGTVFMGSSPKPLMYCAIYPYVYQYITATFRRAPSRFNTETHYESQRRRVKPCSVDYGAAPQEPLLQAPSTSKFEVCTATVQKTCTGGWGSASQGKPYVIMLMPLLTATDYAVAMLRTRLCYEDRGIQHEMRGIARDMYTVKTSMRTLTESVHQLSTSSAVYLPLPVTTVEELQSFDASLGDGKIKGELEYLEVHCLRLPVG
ncbi:unnamed protein product [Dicrocoelium dendriticum]|nr:unnamed protein product [Dicrocoelium dendriticum]